jgi:isopentenyldiphosphate isomerase
MTELLEIFDESGEPLGMAQRHIAHRDGLWHRSSNVFLFQADGRFNGAFAA